MGGVSGEPAAEVIDEIAPQPTDYQIHKHRWSAFYQTELALSLQARDVDTILLAGASTEVGIGSTAYAARDWDFSVVFLRDCLGSARNSAASDYCADTLFPHVGRVRTVDETIALLQRGQPNEVGRTRTPPSTGGIETGPRETPVADPQIDPRQAGLLFFDTMKGYAYERDLRTPRPEAASMLQTWARILRVARDLGMPVFYAQANHRADGSDWSTAITDANRHRLEQAFGKLRLRPLLLQGERGGEIVDEIAPQPDDYRILKHRWSAFHGTHLELSLRTAGIKTIVLAGGDTGIGIISTAYAARDRDFNLLVLRDACYSWIPGVHYFLMDVVFPRMSRVRSVEQTIRLLGAQRQA